jgi:hypothetical protein
MCIGLRVSTRCQISNKVELSRLLKKKKDQISNFIQIRPVQAELFHADRQTDMTKLTVGFRNFKNAPKDRTIRFN